MINFYQTNKSKKQATYDKVYENYIPLYVSQMRYNRRHLEEGDKFEFDTGLVINIPDGYFLEIVPAPGFNYHIQYKDPKSESLMVTLEVVLNNVTVEVGDLVGYALLGKKCTYGKVNTKSDL